MNLGLAMREQPSTSEPDQEQAMVRLSMNLVPPKVSALKLTPGRLAAMIAGVAAIVVITLLLDLVVGVQEDTKILEARLDPIVQQVNLRRVELSRLSQMETGIQEFHDLTAPWGHVTENVELLQGTATEGVEISQIIIDPDKVGFLASAQTIDQAIDFVEALRATEKYKEVPYPRTSTNISASLFLIE